MVCCCNRGWVLFLNVYLGSIGTLAFMSWENSPLESERDREREREREKAEEREREGRGGFSLFIFFIFLKNSFLRILISKNSQKYLQKSLKKS